MPEYFHLSPSQVDDDAFLNKRRNPEEAHPYQPTLYSYKPFWVDRYAKEINGRAGMSAKFYNILAKSIRETDMPQESKAALVSNMSDEFALLNPLFNRMQFLAACMSADRKFIAEMKKHGAG